MRPEPLHFLRTTSLLITAALATGLSAQQPPTFSNAASYDAWKATQVHAPAIVVHEMPEEPTLRGGSATCDCWVEPNTSYHTIDNDTEWDATGFNSTDDGCFGPINLPFQFFLYGQYWNQLYLNINGNVTFGNYLTAFSAGGFPAGTDTIMVAPFWADVDLGGGGANNNIVQYKVTSTAMYVNWTRVGYYSSMTDKLNTFQLIITDGTDPIVPNGANVSFCYKDMQWTTGDASNGSSGFGGYPANVGANKGDAVNYIQFGRFDHAGTDYDGPFGGADGISWLDDKYFTFATSITTGNVPPVVSGQSVCDSLTVCADQMVNLSVDFYSPEPDQITSAISYAATLPGYTTLSSTSGVTASITTGFTPTAADVGYHDVFFEGTDNGNPVMTSVLKIVLNVLPSPQIDPGTLAVCDSDAPLPLFNILGGSPPPNGTWTDPYGIAHGDLFTPGVDMDGTYVYSADIGGVCFASGTATLSTVAHVDAGQGGTLAYCSTAAPVDLYTLLTGTPQPTGTWLDPAGTVVNSTLTPATAASGEYLYYLEATAPCLNDTAFFNISVPQGVNAGLDSSIAFCRDAAPFSLLANLAGTPQATGVWTNLLGAIVPDQFDPATGTFGVYTYTVPAVAPCPDLSSDLTIAIDPLPVAGADASLVVCANDNDVPLFSLLGGSPDMDQHWLDPLGAPHSGLLDPSLEVSGTYTYVSIGPNTCSHLSDTALVNVHIDPVPVITYTADPDSGCHPLLVRFTNTTDPIYVGNSCIWDPGDGTGPVAECGTFDHLYEQPGWYHLKLKITTPQGCTDELVTPGAVLVDPAPVAEFTWTPEFGTIGNSTFVFTATDPHAVDFLWNFPLQDVDSVRQVQRTFEDAIEGTYQVCLGVADRYGCTDTLCKNVDVVVQNIFVPTAFTPNGDGRNDVLIPVTIGTVPADYEFTVFDRWGHVVFHSRDVNKGWDGTNSGSQLPLGNYVWKLSARPIGASDREDHFGTVLLTK